MKLKTAKIFLVACIVLFVGMAFWLGLRNIPYFDIKKIEIKYSGPVEDLGEDINRCIIPYKGLNLFNADLKKLQYNLSQFEGVETASVKRFFPSDIIIEIAFKQYLTRVWVDYNGKKLFFLADTTGLYEVSEKTYNLFSLLTEVEIESKYASVLLKWGSDNGFAQMCVLAQILGQKSLITKNKYDNNSSDDFGLMKIEIPAIQSELYVREPVKPDRLIEAIDVIARNKNTDGSYSKFDLYSNALIKRRDK